MYPSYLKQLKGKEMQTIWHHAAQAVAQAQDVEICGYSLPESDTAMRVLLNPLSFRLDDGVVDVVVRDPKDDVHERWTDFLGPRVQIDARPI